MSVSLFLPHRRPRTIRMPAYAITRDLEPHKEAEAGVWRLFEGIDDSEDVKIDTTDDQPRSGIGVQIIHLAFTDTLGWIQLAIASDGDTRCLWWGHRCPAYFVRIKGQEQDATDGKWWVVGRDLEEATEWAKKVVGGSSFTLEQDEDVLDCLDT
ncbi:hypothetical protein BC826DRAFT_1174577 [Russula brevipes]|nr:hypothetical protein BC826DRAFT_1174577 [Russula brevipes]